MRLLSGTGDLCGIEYFKLVFLKYLNVPTWSIFAGLVTYNHLLYIDTYIFKINYENNLSKPVIYVNLMSTDTDL